MQEAPASKITPNMIDGANLKSNESVGTFRWADDIKLIHAPKFDKTMMAILLEMDKGWQAYVEPRFAPSAVGDQINIEPH
jgi:hypothetical protein